MLGGQSGDFLLLKCWSQRLSGLGPAHSYAQTQAHWEWGFTFFLYIYIYFVVVVVVVLAHVKEFLQN